MYWGVRELQLLKKEPKSNEYLEIGFSKNGQCFLLKNTYELKPYNPKQIKLGIQQLHVFGRS